MALPKLSLKRPKALGMMTGMRVTFSTMLKTWAFNLSGGRLGLRSTVNYPKVKETPVPRARGVRNRRQRRVARAARRCDEQAVAGRATESAPPGAAGWPRPR